MDKHERKKVESEPKKINSTGFDRMNCHNYCLTITKSIDIVKGWRKLSIRKASVFNKIANEAR